MLCASPHFPALNMITGFFHFMVCAFLDLVLAEHHFIKMCEMYFSVSEECTDCCTNFNCSDIQQNVIGICGVGFFYFFFPFVSGCCEAGPPVG